MEQSSTGLSYDEVPLGKSENSSDSDKNDKKTTKRTPIKAVWLDSKAAPKPEADFLYRPTEQKEQQPKNVEQHIPDADEAWKGIERRLRADRELMGATEATVEDYQAQTLEAHLSLDNGEIQDLPLTRPAETKLATVEMPKKIIAEDIKQPEEVSALEPQAPETIAPLLPETAEPVPVAMTSTEGGGHNFEPPLPPNRHDSPGQPEHAPEPPELAPPTWFNQADHEARMAGAVPVSELSTSPTKETRIVERRTANNGAGLALFVGFADWRRGRKTRKELRRGQKRQDAQIKNLQETQKQTSQQLTEQQATNRRLRDQHEQTTSRLNQSEAQTQKLVHEQSRPGPVERHVQPPRPETIAPVLRSAIAETAVEKTLELPPDHHIESSVWHNIEVDKAGHSVEKPVFSYGHEFQREQQQEVKRDNVNLAVAATGQLAVNSGASAPAPTPPHDASSLHIPPSMVDDGATPSKKTSPLGSLPSALQNPFILILIIILFFAVVSLVIVR